MKQLSHEIKKFSLIAISFIAITIFLGYHVANILFGDTSLEVYNSLKYKKKSIFKKK